jgi:integrase
LLTDMARPYPYLQSERNRHGNLVWYYRVGEGPRTRIWGEYGSPEFTAAYRAALAGATAPEAVRKPQTGSLAWLVARYMETSAWASLSAATRRQRENILNRMVRESGETPYNEINRKDIVATIDKRRDKAAAARHFLETARGMFRWALDAELLTVDPTIGVRAPRKTGDGFEPWTDEDCARYEARWPLGTRERLAFDVLRWTGLRRGDAVAFGRPHVRRDVATMRTEKTGEVVTFRIVPALAASIAAGPCGELTYIAGERGKPMTKESFGNWFRKACRVAGVEKSAHGLRKTGAMAHAIDGATELELMARYAWTEPRTAAIYTRKANREKLALAADAKMETARNANAGAPHLKSITPHPEKKRRKSA